MKYKYGTLFEWTNMGDVNPVILTYEGLISLKNPTLSWRDKTIENQKGCHDNLIDSCIKAGDLKISKLKQYTVINPEPANDPISDIEDMVKDIEKVAKKAVKDVFKNVFDLLTDEDD